MSGDDKNGYTVNPRKEMFRLSLNRYSLIVRLGWRRIESRIVGQHASEDNSNAFNYSDENGTGNRIVSRGFEASSGAETATCDK